MREPRQPTEKERSEHSLTHVPFRSWCKACVLARLKENPYRPLTLYERKHKDKTTVQLDYMFPWDDGDCKVLAMTETKTGNTCATMVLAKESGDRYAVHALKQMIDEAGDPEANTQTDSEGAAVDLAPAAAALRPEGRHEVKVTPAGSSQSSAAVERMNQTVAAMCRTFKVLVEDEYHIKIVEGHVLNAWLVRLSAWVYSRYQRRESGQTAFQELKGVAYTSDLVPFGEMVAGHSPQKHCKKMESDWHLGIWVGRTSNSNEYILLTQKGVLRCKSVRRLELAERYNKKIMEDAKGLQWDQRPPRDHADGRPFEGRELPRGMPGQSEDRRPGAELAQFHASCGQTPGCQACLEKRRGFHHTVACKARQQEWQDRRESEETETSGQGPSEPAQESATMSEGQVLPQRQLEVTQCDDDCFARQDQNMNGPNWMTNPSQWTNINESKSWTTTHLEWEANERN